MRQMKSATENKIDFKAVRQKIKSQSIASIFFQIMRWSPKIDKYQVCFDFIYKRGPAP